MRIEGESPPFCIAQAMRLEGWPQATDVQATTLRDERKNALLRMRSESVETMISWNRSGFLSSALS
jgi:hypothetical protein